MISKIIKLIISLALGFGLITLVYEYKKNYRDNEAYVVIRREVCITNVKRLSNQMWNEECYRIERAEDCDLPVETADKLKLRMNELNAECFSIK